MKRRWMNWIVKADFPTPAQNHSNKINGEYEGWCEPPPPTTTSLYCLKNWAYAQVKQCSDMKTWQADIPWQWEWQPYQRDEYILKTDINISSYPGPSRQLNQATSICNLFPGSNAAVLLISHTWMTLETLDFIEFHPLATLFFRHGQQQ